LAGVTRLPVTRPTVMIGTSDGRRWLLGPRQAQPNLDAVATVYGVGGLGAAYLVAPTLAVASARQLARRSESPLSPGVGAQIVEQVAGAPRTGEQAWTGTLQFATQSIGAKAIAVDGDAEVALLELTIPATATPLALQTDVGQGDPWQVFALASGGTATAGP